MRAAPCILFTLAVLLAGCRSAERSAALSSDLRPDTAPRPVEQGPRMTRISRPAELDALLDRGVAATLNVGTNTGFSLSYKDGARCTIVPDAEHDNIFELVRENGADRSTEKISMPRDVFELWLAEKLGAGFELPSGGRMRIGVGRYTSERVGDGPVEISESK